MFTNLPNLIFKARETVYTNICFSFILMARDSAVVSTIAGLDRNQYATGFDTRRLAALYMLGAEQTCYLFGIGKLVPVSTGVNGSTPLNRTSLIELWRILNARHLYRLT